MITINPADHQDIYRARLAVFAAAENSRMRGRSPRTGIAITDNKAKVLAALPKGDFVDVSVIAAQARIDVKTARRWLFILENEGAAVRVKQKRPTFGIRYVWGRA
jgi:ribosomal protein S25